MTQYQQIAVLLISVFFCLQSFCTARAEDDKEVITAGPSWESFTNEDGRGLYHDIIRKVFAGYEIKHVYVSSVQANSMVAIGRADIKMCETKEIESLVLATVPMYENDFHALFLREKVGAWAGNTSLVGKKLVWRRGYYSSLDFSVPVDFVEVRSGESALKMVMHGRAALYIDDYYLIRQSFAQAGEKLDHEKFGLERVGTRKYFPLFAATPRGDRLRNHYEKEMERLYREGVLQKIYKHWGFPMPEFGFNDPGK